MVMSYELFTYREKVYLLDRSEHRGKYSVTADFEIRVGERWYLEYFGKEYEITITKAISLSLGEVAKKYYSVEGFLTVEEFYQNWMDKSRYFDSTHTSIDPNQPVWRYEFTYREHHA
jgi:hypothetical protein